MWWIATETVREIVTMTVKVTEKVTETVIGTVTVTVTETVGAGGGVGVPDMLSLCLQLLDTSVKVLEWSTSGGANSSLDAVCYILAGIFVVIVVGLAGCLLWAQVQRFKEQRDGDNDDK